MLILKDNLVNDWQCETTANVGEGERLVAVSWIDNGIKVINELYHFLIFNMIF